jgi:outer membrane receptor protein involved in Fe transport
MAFGFLTVWMEGSTEAIAQQPSAPMQIAQEESLRTEEVVISATKTPQPLQEVTSSVQVITGDELEQRKTGTDNQRASRITDSTDHKARMEG